MKKLNYVHIVVITIIDYYYCNSMMIVYCELINERITLNCDEYMNARRNCQ